MAAKVTEFAPLKDGAGFPFPVEDVMLPLAHTYPQNPLVKKAHLNIELSGLQMVEYIRCKRDPIYFIETYCRIITLDDGVQPFKMYQFQKDMVRLYMKNRFALTLTARQMGKTTVMAGFILWFAIFHKSKQIAVLANKGDQAQEIMDRIRLMFEYLPFFLQPGVEVYNKTSLVFENKSKVFSAATSSSAIRGRSVDLVYIDEAAFIERDMEFYESTYPVISSGENSKVIMTTTPKGTRGMFYTLWRASEEGANSYQRMVVSWQAHPKRDEEWAKTTRENIGPARFRQEFEVEFRGSSGTLISGAILELLHPKLPINDQENLSIFELPIEDHKYVAVVDCSEGVGQDYSVVTMFDVSVKPYNVVARFRDNTLSQLLLPHHAIALCKQYNEALLLIESNNDVGGQVSYIAYYELEYENTITTRRDERGMELNIGGRGANPGVKTTRKVKSIGCATLKTLLENDMLAINDDVMIGELGTFIAKGSSYEADEGCHDDTVMTLVIFSWFVNTDFFKDEYSADVGSDVYQNNIERLMEDMMPFGFVAVAKPDVPQVTSHGVKVTEGSMAEFARWMND